MNFINNNPRIKKLIFSGKIDRAIDHLKKLIYKQKDIDLNSIILSQVYLINKEILKAIDALENILPKINLINKEYQFEIYKFLGDYYYKIEDYKKSYLNYQLALAIKKEDNQIMQKVAHIYLDLNNYQKAGQIFKYLNELEPNNIYYKCMLSLYYTEIHDFKNAEIILTDLIKVNNDNCMINYYYGYYNYIAKEYDKALQYFKLCHKDKALKLKSLYYSGKSAMIKENYDDAVNYFQEAKIEIDFQNKMTLDIYYSLALCFEKLNDYHSALNELKFIYKTNQEYRDIKEKIVSEKYKNANEKFLIKYNNFTNDQYNYYCVKIIKSINFKILDQKSIDENIFLLKVLALNNFEDKLFFNKNDKIVIAFIRNVKISEDFIDELIKIKLLKINKRVLIVSQNISPVIQDYIKKNNFDLINITSLNDLKKI